MALGKIKADTLEHSTAGSLDTQYVVNGSAKAFVNFNGNGTVAIKSNLNTSSITDNGTGDYTANLASAMSNALYTGLASARDVSTGTNVVAADGNTTRTVGASAFHVWAAFSGQSNKTLYDALFIDIVIHGDLA